MNDALTHILRRLRLRAGIFAHAQYCGRWAVDTSGSRMATFHLVNRGGCWLHRPNQAPQPLQPGDLVVFPRDAAHVIASDQDPPDASDINQAAPEPNHPDIDMLCGYFEFHGRSIWPLLDSLPAAVVLTGEQSLERGDTAGLLAVIRGELDQPGGASEVVLDCYAQALFIHVLRAVVRMGHANAQLRAFADPKIGAALNLIHARPELRHSLDSLAASTNMSRTGFATRFRALVGQTPMHYLAAWRMQVAMDLLGQSSISMIEVAERTGYRSEVAFRKAFRRLTGMTPGQARRSGSSVEQDPSAPATPDRNLHP